MTLDESRGMSLSRLGFWREALDFEVESHKVNLEIRRLGRVNPLLDDQDADQPGKSPSREDHP